jgi:uncharacterized protein involved in exopolysaccharide biosynthesis
MSSTNQKPSHPSMVFFVIAGAVLAAGAAIYLIKLMSAAEIAMR